MGILDGIGMGRLMSAGALLERDQVERERFIVITVCFCKLDRGVSIKLIEVEELIYESRSLDRA
jgi:hypothetical protein